ncbi:MAG: hypothetical protein CM1200mP2_09150 [Planctomycetaceae bacterium]|nr:MAG: hypothetical protein CM1200mP2_09150 [Planctomycetaceae bacterium]
MPNQGKTGRWRTGQRGTLYGHRSALVRHQAEIVKIDMLRKQVDGMMSELSGLNRDLNYDENTHTSRQDKDAWDDARRMMRNAHMQLSRCQKACDVGDTQSAGKKEWMKELHDTQTLAAPPDRESDGDRGRIPALPQDADHPGKSGQRCVGLGCDRRCRSGAAGIGRNRHQGPQGQEGVTAGPTCRSSRVGTRTARR